jgi:hypothetical protein
MTVMKRRASHRDSTRGNSNSKEVISWVLEVVIKFVSDCAKKALIVRKSNRRTFFDVKMASENKTMSRVISIETVVNLDGKHLLKIFKYVKLDRHPPHPAFPHN